MRALQEWYMYQYRGKCGVVCVVGVCELCLVCSVGLHIMVTYPGYRGCKTLPGVVRQGIFHPGFFSRVGKIENLSEMTSKNLLS